DDENTTYDSSFKKQKKQENVGGTPPIAPAKASDAVDIIKYFSTDCVLAEANKPSPFSPKPKISYEYDNETKADAWLWLLFKQPDLSTETCERPDGVIRLF